jgi:RimJ/RimL family protein N-acetyltransferase
MQLKSLKPRFILRHAKNNDLKDWFNHQLDKETMRNFMTVPKNLKEARKELFEKNKDSEGFVIDVDGLVVGGIGVHDIVKGHKAVISYWVARKLRNKGIATKAVKMATDYFFKKYKLVRISGNARTFNKASARVMEKAGYKLEGVLRKNKLKDHEFLDDEVWAKVK